MKDPCSPLSINNLFMKMGSTLTISRIISMWIITQSFTVLLSKLSFLVSRSLSKTVSQYSSTCTNCHRKSFFSSNIFLPQKLTPTIKFCATIHYSFRMKGIDSFWLLPHLHEKSAIDSSHCFSILCFLFVTAILPLGQVLIPPWILITLLDLPSLLPNAKTLTAYTSLLLHCAPGASYYQKEIL